jgi:hypothetical protein
MIDKKRPCMACLIWIQSERQEVSLKFDFVILHTCTLPTITWPKLRTWSALDSCRRVTVRSMILWLKTRDKETKMYQPKSKTNMRLGQDNNTTCRGAFCLESHFQKLKWRVFLCSICWFRAAHLLRKKNNQRRIRIYKWRLGLIIQHIMNSHVYSYQCNLCSSCYIHESKMSTNQARLKPDFFSGL